MMNNHSVIASLLALSLAAACGTNTPTGPIGPVGSVDMSSSVDLARMNTPEGAACDGIDNDGNGLIDDGGCSFTYGVYPPIQLLDNTLNGTYDFQPLVASGRNETLQTGSILRCLTVYNGGAPSRSETKISGLPAQRGSIPVPALTAGQSKCQIIDPNNGTIWSNIIRKFKN
jgi:hypothetical protein